MDYGIPDKRKSKNDRRAKSRYNKFKRGGSQRSTNIQLSNKKS
ncbi:MAG: hypothetical protein Q7S74_01775 [Nanoarchaeota archaeon]|nr:hypothetical protein [Nanoarchaeota archaeon]